MKERIVAHLIATNFYGGPERQIINHALHLTRRSQQYSPLVVSFQEGKRENEILAKAELQGISHDSILAPGAINFRAITELTIILKKHGVSILVGHGYKANVIGRLASWRVGLPFVAVSRGWTTENWKVGLYQMIDKLFLRWATRVVAVSEGQRQKILRLGIPGQRVSVIHNAMDLEALPAHAESSVRTELGVPASAVFICSAGRLSPEKNQALLVDAARILCAERPDLYFCIFGEGVCRTALEKRIQLYDLTGKFFLPGFRSDLLSYFHEIDIFTLPSLSEGLPNVVLEAYAYCKPIVAANTGGTPEVVQHGKTGYLHEPNDLDALVRYLALLAKDRTLRVSMGQEGQRLVGKDFTYPQQAERYEQLYGMV